MKRKLMKNKTCARRQNLDIMHNILPVGEGVHKPTACIFFFSLNLCICHTDNEKKNGLTIIQELSWLHRLSSSYE